MASPQHVLITYANLMAAADWFTEILVNIVFYNDLHGKNK